MIPPFELHRPADLQEAVEQRAALGDDAALLSGGTELLLIMKLGLADYAHVIDVKRIAELQALSVTDGTLRIGAAVTHRRIERAPEVRTGWPELAAMEGGVANVRVRHVGTLGGNLCFADPHSDPATFLLAAGAEVACAGSGGVRRLGIGEFTLGMYECALRPDEVLVSIDVPAVPAGAGLAHEKFCLRERPTATVAAYVHAPAGVISDARVVVGSVTHKPERNGEAEGRLVGLPVDELEAAGSPEAAEAAAASVDPISDDTASADYRRQLVRVLVTRAVRHAAQQAARRTA